MRTYPTLLLSAAGMLVTAGLLHTPVNAHDDPPRLDILSETPDATLSVDRGALDDPPRVTHHDDGTISITTVGYQDCPVLPTRIDETVEAALIVLGPVPNAHSCGDSLQSYTTVIRVAGLNTHQQLSMTDGALTG